MSVDVRVYDEDSGTAVRSVILVEASTKLANPTNSDNKVPLEYLPTIRVFVADGGSDEIPAEQFTVDVLRSALRPLVERHSAHLNSRR